MDTRKSRTGVNKKFIHPDSAGPNRQRHDNLSRASETLAAYLARLSLHAAAFSTAGHPAVAALAAAAPYPASCGAPQCLSRLGEPTAPLPALQKTWEVPSSLLLLPNHLAAVERAELGRAGKPLQGFAFETCCAGPGAIALGYAPKATAAAEGAVRATENRERPEESGTGGAGDAED